MNKCSGREHGMQQRQWVSRQVWVKQRRKKSTRAARVSGGSRPHTQTEKARKKMGNTTQHKNKTNVEERSTQTRGERETRMKIDGGVVVRSPLVCRARGNLVMCASPILFFFIAINKSKSLHLLCHFVFWWTNTYCRFYSNTQHTPLRISLLGGFHS